MKNTIPALFCLVGALTVEPATAQECVNADPASVLASVHGDSEVIVDPQDAERNLILTANVGDGMSKVAIARIDGRTGQVTPGSLSIIANNFYGLTRINGPEFVQKPTGELGVLYAGLGGVRAAFRSAIPEKWNEFSFDVTGKRIFGNPPLLPSTSNGAYPAPPTPLRQNTYGQYRGDCTGICFGALGQGVTTDVVAAVLAAKGLTTAAATQSPDDGQIYLSACGASGSCGLYEAVLDGVGGFVAGSFQKLAEMGTTAPVSLAAARHPRTGSTVLFSNKGSGAVDVWEHSSDGGALRLVRRVPASGSVHFRAEVDAREVVLHYLVKSGANAGSYTIPVVAAGRILQAGGAKKVNDNAAGAEIAWLPAAEKWAVFFRTANVLQRCWITP